MGDFSLECASHGSSPVFHCVWFMELLFVFQGSWRRGGWLFKMQSPWPLPTHSEFWFLGVGRERLETRISINFLFCLHLHNWPIDTNELTFVLTRQSARSHFPICLLLLCTALPDFPLIANPQVPRMSPGANNQSTWGLLFWSLQACLLLQKAWRQHLTILPSVGIPQLCLTHLLLVVSRTHLQVFLCLCPPFCHHFNARVVLGAAWSGEKDPVSSSGLHIVTRA